MEKLQEAAKFGIGMVNPEDGVPVLRAKFARLPEASQGVRFLVEILEPIHLIPQEYSVPSSFLRVNPCLDYRDYLKDALLQDQKLNMTQIDPEKIVKLFHEITEVELIECDLLVPKVK